MPWQKINAAADRRRNMLAAWNLDSGKLVPLGKDPVNEQVTPIRRTNLATVAEWSKYAFEPDDRPAGRRPLSRRHRDRRADKAQGQHQRSLRAGEPGAENTCCSCRTTTTGRSTWPRGPSRTSPSPRPCPSSTRNRTRRSSRSRPSGSRAGPRTTRPSFSTTSTTSGKSPPTVRRPQKLTDGAAEQVRHRLVRLERRREAASGRRRGSGRRRSGDRSGQAPVLEPLRRMDEEIRLRPAAQAGRRGHPSRLARQERRLAGQGQGRRGLRLHPPGLRRSRPTSSSAARS